MLKKLLSMLLSFVLLISILPIFEHNAYASVNEPQVHVKLKNYLGNKTQVTLKPSGTYKTIDGKVSLNSNTEYILKLEQSQLKLYQGSKTIYQSTSFTLASSDSDSSLSINNRSYKGSFEFIMETISGKNYIRPINTVGMEDYLKGVVPREMPALWDLEALKAQAVAARTYSWNYGGQTITDTINHQVYGGLTDSHPNSNKAVDSTTGQVLKYNGKLISAVFSASNGGVMEAAKNVWGYEYGYLKNELDPYDTSFNWDFSLQKTQIDMKDKDLVKPDTWWKNASEKDSKIISLIKTWLNNNGYKDKDIKIVSIPTLSFNNPSSTKRVTTGSITVQFYVKDIKDKDGKLILQEVKQTNVAASRVRAMIGIDNVKSYLITKSSSNSTAHSIAGKGYGHGVGLSQYGANNRAKAGQKYNEILAFYYPGAKLVTEYTQTDISAPVIKDIKASFVNSNDNVRISFNINKAATVIVRIKDITGKIVSTLLNNKSLNAGSYSYTADASSWSNGSYTTEVIATNSNNQTTSSSAIVQVSKVEAPTISSISTKYDSDPNRIVVSFKGNQPTKTTVIIKDNNNKVIKTLASNQSIAVGTTSYNWDVSNVNNGNYTLEITSVNSVGKSSSAKQNFTLKKAEIVAPSIKDIKTSYTASNNQVKVSFHVDQTAKTTVELKDSNNKVIKTLASDESKAAGTRTYNWDVSKVNNGTYTVAITSTNNSGQKKTATQKFTLQKPTAPTIKDIKTNYTASNNQMKISFNVNQTTKTTVQIKDNKNKVIKTLANNQSIATGTRTYNWDVSKVNNGTYTVSVTSTNTSGQKKTANQKFTLKKAIAPTIKEMKTSYDTSGNKIKVSFHVNQASTTTVKIVNGKNKVVKTLASNKSIKAGIHSYTWNVGNASDGSYTVSIESVNGSKLKKTATKKFTLYKVKTGTVKATNLNIRQKPNASSKKVGSIPNNKKITIFEKSGAWYKIKYGKVTGYVSVQYVKNVK